MSREGYVYIMASRRNGTLYIGATSDLIQRAWQHREGMMEGFTKRYGCKFLVWFERFETIEAAREQEVRMKKWNRDWKIKRILERNPEWNDLYPGLLG